MFETFFIDVPPGVALAVPYRFVGCATQHVVEKHGPGPFAVVGSLKGEPAGEPQLLAHRHGVRVRPFVVTDRTRRSVERHLHSAVRPFTQRHGGLF